MNAATEFGSNLGFLWETDPRMLGIRMARYKFVAKMLVGMMHSVLEVGAGDGSLARIVRQAVRVVVTCDKDPQAPDVVKADLTTGWRLGRFDAVYALDVLEHVVAEDEDAFMRNMCLALDEHGTCIIGMPSLESQAYASSVSKAGHVNCKTEEQLRELMLRHFRCVYLFGMNDETLHTGFGPMCHYRLAIATTKRQLSTVTNLSGNIWTRELVDELVRQLHERTRDGVAL